MKMLALAMAFSHLSVKILHRGGPKDFQRKMCKSSFLRRKTVFSHLPLMDSTTSAEPESVKALCF